jgi:hypothetical protein
MHNQYLGFSRVAADLRMAERQKPRAGDAG